MISPPGDSWSQFDACHFDPSQEFIVEVRFAWGRRGVALGAFAFEAIPLATVPAMAAANQVSAGPASFADIVDKVKSSVVSVKVKIAEDADASDGDDDPAGWRP